MGNIEGFCKGEVCNRNGCNGIIDEIEKEGGCSCHICPPCDYCVNLDQFCPKCNWENEDIPMVNKIENITTIKTEPKIIEDDGFKYNIYRYFDDVLEGFSGTNLTYGNAKRETDRLNSQPRHYVYYELKKVK